MNKDRGDEFLDQKKEGLDKLAKLHSKWELQRGSLKELFGYAKKLAGSSKTEDKTAAENIKKNLERYLTELSRAYDTICQYTPKKKKKKSFMG